MRTIVWHVPPEYGHFAPTILLANQLAAQGFRSIYLSERDMQGHIEKAGFSYAPYLPDVYPKGALQARDQLSADDTWEWWLGRDLAMWQEASSGRLEAVFSSLKPDLIMSSSPNPDTSLVAHKMKIPFIRVSCSFPLYYEPDMPPMWSDALPGELSRRELEREWMCHEALFFRRPWIDRDNPIKRSDFYRFVEACGVHAAQINYRSAYNYHVESDPEIITCSKALDFPKADIPNRAYVGPCLPELDAAPWTYPARRPDAPLIYCAFGSKASSYPGAKHVIGRLLETASARPELDIVLAAPDDVLAGLQIPSTVHTLAWAPQREILREADLFITHAGLSSCRESIWEGVPMLAVPQAHDQRGDSARIVYHGLGERLIGPRPSTASFMAAIDRLLTDRKYLEAADRMRALFRADAKEAIGVRFVTDVMEGRIKPETFADYENVSSLLFRNMVAGE
ncbi:MAG: hypothetical protein H6Q90_1176 [Deltaproteobacteria bacterium]|nr:hypothetical protein [Deltaproteobacteria bacterium]